MLGHLAFAIEFIAWIEKFPVIAFADELIEFGFGEGLFVEIARSEVEFKFEQETSCFAAGGSSGFLVEDEFCGHGAPVSSEFLLEICS